MVSVVHGGDNCFLQVSNLRLSAYRAANKDIRYTLDQFLKLRRNYVAYSIFYSTFIPTIAGRKLMKQLVEDTSVIEEVCTISDEALALLGLENGVERWDDVFARCKGDVRPFPKGQTIPEAMRSTVTTKYTVSSKPDPNSEKEGNDKRWSQEGIIQFNQLRQLIIKKDRAKYPDFVTKWLAQERNTMGTGNTARAKDDSNTVNADDNFQGSPVKIPARVLKEASQQEDVLHNDDEDDDEDENEDKNEDDDDESEHFGA
jgi:hypothetical protein